MMNQFTAEALGTVLAFIRVSDSTCQKGRAALVEAFGEDQMLDIAEKNRMYADSIIRVVTDATVIDTAIAKAAAVESILLQMQDAYIGGQWADSATLMQWIGFFEGASIVNWGTVRGAAEAIDTEELLELADEASNWHYEMLELAEGYLDSIGQSKVSA